MISRERGWLLGARWKPMVGGLLLGIAVALAVIQLSTPQYASTATLLVSARNSGAAATVEANELAIQRMPTYVELARSERVAQDVVDGLQLPLTRDQLLRMVTATVSPGTSLLTIGVTAADPNRAAAVANAIAQRIVARSGELEQPPPAPAPAPAPGISAQVVADALPATSPVFPQPVPTVVLGALLGLLAAIVLLVLRRALAPRITHRRQLGRVLQAPVLATVARDRGAGRHPLVVRDEPRGARAEVYRRLRATLQPGSTESAAKVVMVTSPSPGDGSTSVLCNLAYVMAETGQRVLVVEADYDRPRAADWFGVSRAVGLTDVLTGTARLDGLVQPTPGGVDVISSGGIPANPGQVLASPLLAAFLHEARLRYHVVLVDVASVLRVADATVLAPLVDGIVLVVRHGTPVRRVENAREALQVGPAHLLGAVLTRAPGGVARGDARYATPAPAPEPAPSLPAPRQPEELAVAANGAADLPPRPSPFPRNRVPRPRPSR
jgi:succinoglycan biosynthesis transport protein ExoP